MVEMSRSRFAVLVDDAIEQLPVAVRGMLDNVVIRVAELDERDPSLLGVYEGTALTDRLSDYTFALPDTITLFRLAILEICQTEQDVEHEVAVTVVHEIGHHLGMDEQRLHELGWG
jgi:predicted Zn-dependent protease with MMP-like domain